jgi:hypothetical protein
MADEPLLLHITKEKIENLPWGLQDTLQKFIAGEIEGSDSPHLRSIIAEFMVDKSKKPLARKECDKVLFALRNEQIKQAMQKLYDAIVEYAIPKENGNAST